MARGGGRTRVPVSNPCVVDSTPRPLARPSSSRDGTRDGADLGCTSNISTRDVSCLTSLLRSEASESTSGRQRLKASMRPSMDFICAARPSSLSSAVAMRVVRVGCLDLGASGRMREYGSGGGSGGAAVVGAEGQRRWGIDACRTNRRGTQLRSSQGTSTVFYESRSSDRWGKGFDTRCGDPSR